MIVSTINYMLVGITRDILIKQVKEKGYKVVERDISISEFFYC